MQRPLNLPETCTFSDYFNLNAYPEDILGHFGYGFEVRSLQLPSVEVEQHEVEMLRDRLEIGLPLITFNNESVRREFLIAPVLLTVLKLTQAKLKTSYPVDISKQLRGSLDYFIESGQNLLVIEAKDENLERGFQQLAVELVAIAKTTDELHKMPIWGAVSIGKIWQFAVLNPNTQAVTQDLNLYRVPADLMPLIQGLVGILTDL